ncbi:MAPK regulated corepressor interacting protein 2 [Eurytemora carolleeae]|uniref:MAPK regulated corepressor interacting protein 2 n=1 Tax=Eurytemora carolleeae TaxID=1294199 RepID=UPI000C77FE36|nr:MAPK regulated corepressor interacting protein 2 [Eurytemora carolleeae]|eukprot:XP_023344606.1 MAPK regulated corepressor interacting protein 2-like [Eurytemora affinis]
MYTVAKGPTQILQKSRRSGLKQHAESLDGQKSRSVSPQLELVNETHQLPRLVFQNVNEKRGNRRVGRGEKRKEEYIRGGRHISHLKPTKEHRQLVTFLSTSWSQIRTELESDCGVVVYSQSKTSDVLDFTPLDLDSWMEKKIYEKLMLDL